ncbi:MAG: glycine--tRNA ligase subunit beta [Alphaproteobacteria bacterium]|nr:glycine--tRNA ligase subunit beta [Alphaproteobacteria bacterium]
MSELLLELFSEEIPARMQRHAAESLKTRLNEGLKEAKLSASSILTYVTPRRLTAVIEGLPSELQATNSEKRGPRVGAPQQALEGFCRGAGCTTEDLEERDGYYFAVIRSEGGAVAPIIQGVIEKILADFHWPKTMRWGAHHLSWVRPLQSILCLFDGKVVPVEFGHLIANNTTKGHRFLSDNLPITIHNSEEYFAKLRKAHVIVDQDERRSIIESTSADLAKKRELTVKRDPALLDEVTGLVEWPVPLMGGFESRYLALPQEVPTTVMRSHQKYFALTDAAGELASQFITVSNLAANDDGKAIIAGNERVLRARLADGQFFWDQDLKRPLAEWCTGLNDMVFHAKLGSVADKADRIRSLATFLAVFVPHAGLQDVDRAAALCKADLTTGMVGEFPELQGLMGKYYALAQNEKPEVAAAIEDHYAPQGPSDDCPTAPVSVTIALADKMDTLVGLFAIGEKPTGSKDPYALRRAALGVIRLILENHLRIPVEVMIDKAVAKYPRAFYKQTAKEESAASGKRTRAGKLRSAIADELLDFFSGRLKVMLRDQGIAHDRIEAVFNDGDEDDIYRLVNRVTALDNFLKTDDGANLLAAYKRATNIVRIEEEKSDNRYDGHVDKRNLEQDEEKLLYTQLERVTPMVEKLLKKEEYAAAMAAIAELRAPVDAFFEKVTVNAEDKTLRANRLRLLGSIRSLLDDIANFSLIEG